MTVGTVGTSLEYVLGLDSSKKFTSNQNALASGLLEGAEKDMHLPEYQFSYTGPLGRIRCSPLSNAVLLRAQPMIYVCNLHDLGAQLTVLVKISVGPVVGRLFVRLSSLIPSLEKQADH